jgi:TIM21
MHFHVEGTEARGVVNVHMTKGIGEKELAYELLSLNVPGQPVIYLENKADEVSVKAKVGKMFGVQWR